MKVYTWSYSHHWYSLDLGQNAPRTWLLQWKMAYFSEAVTSTGSVMTPVTINANGNITQIRSVQKPVLVEAMLGVLLH